HRTDLVTGGAIAVIGAVYYIATFSIEETANIVTPRTFPAIVGIALIVLGLFLAGQAVYRARKAALADAGPRNHINGTGAGNGAAASAGESAASTGESGPRMRRPADPPWRPRRNLPRGRSCSSSRSSSSTWPSSSRSASCSRPWPSSWG